MGTGSARGAVAGLARAVLGGNRRRRGEGENGDQATMNTNSEVKKARDQRGSIGARRLRRFTARTVLGVPESQAWWTLKRPDRRRAEAALFRLRLRLRRDRVVAKRRRRRAAEAEGRAPFALHHSSEKQFSRDRAV